MVQETGMYYLQSRYYDPEICRFINADAFVATGQGILGNNMFAYCNNNPILFTDPLGMYVVPDDPLRGPVWMHIGGNASGISSTGASGGPDGLPLSIGGILRSIIDFFRPEKDNAYSNDSVTITKQQSYNYNGLKTEKYVRKRGWSDEMIRYAIENGQQGTSVNAANNSSCTVYKYPGTNNQYVVIDNTTNSIVQVSNFNDSGWIVDSRIQWTS